MVYIYTLASSETPEEIRYIGKTTNIKTRLRRHTSKYYLEHETTYKNNWIKSELLKGNTILIKEIDCVEEENWQISEKFYINKYKELGFKLTNSTIGGEGIILTEGIIKKRNNTRISNNIERINEEIIFYNIIEVNGKWIGNRNCPKCGEIIKYNTMKKITTLNSMRRANKEKRECFSCSNSGENNSFYGKKFNDGHIKKEKFGKKILQYNKKGELINEFGSIREANEKTGIDRKSISNCAKGVKSYNTAGGFIFKIKEN